MYFTCTSVCEAGEDQLTVPTSGPTFKKTSLFRGNLINPISILLSSVVLGHLGHFSKNIILKSRHGKPTNLLEENLIFLCGSPGRPMYSFLSCVRALTPYIHTLTGTFYPSTYPKRSSRMHWCVPLPHFRFCRLSTSAVPLSNSPNPSKLNFTLLQNYDIKDTDI